MLETTIAAIGQLDGPAMAAARERRDYRATHVAPGRLAVQQHDRRAVGRTLVDIVHAQRLGVVGGHLHVVRRKRVAHKVGGAGVRSSQDVHAAPHARLVAVLNVSGCASRDPRAVSCVQSVLWSGAAKLKTFHSPATSPVGFSATRSRCCGQDC